MSRFNRELQLTLQAAMREAIQRRHAYLTVEHLLFALCHDERGSEVLRHSGVNLKRLKTDLERYLDDDIEGEPGEEPIETGQTLAFHRVIQQALAHADNAQRDEVEAGDLVAAIFQEPDSQAVTMLRAQGVSRLDVLKYISHGISKLPESRSGAEANGAGPSSGHSLGDGDDDEDDVADPLTAFSTNLTERAAEGKLDPLVGREAEIDRVIHVLARRRKNNPILVGESGVGKTAIAEGLA
ncbi:MAG: Clp protease N-terminal domain-containing protein, partial [bacterium]